MKHGQYMRIANTLKVFREVHPDFALPMMFVFLEISQAGAEGLTVTQVQKRTGVSQSAASRHCRMLTNEGVRGRDGFDLCDWNYDLNDQRIRIIRLNNNGLVVSKKLEDALA